ncbi:MAG: cytochrome-c peroxidase [Gammaproteobacteria bacterium]
MNCVIVSALCLGSEFAAAERAPLGLPPVVAPADNPTNAAKIVLGKALFFDKRLSADGTIRCASCHDAKRAFTDGNAVSKGIHGARGTRNAPSLLNVAYATTLFWDGRRNSLEDQANDPFVNPIEHGLGSTDAVVRVVRGDAQYREQFARAFGIVPTQITMAHVVKAIASFERSLISADAPFDRYFYAGEQHALSDSARRGFALFRGRARCVSCHRIEPKWALFTDNAFHTSVIGRYRVDKRLGDLATQVVRARGQNTDAHSARETTSAALDKLILTRPEISELGRFVVTLKPIDIGSFKTPSLRNVAMTGPYMHDGSMTSLSDVVELELYGHGPDSRHPIILTPQEKNDLVEFLKSLTSR